MGNPSGRRSFWGWGLAAAEPTEDDRRKLASSLSDRYGGAIDARPLPTIEEVELRPPRIQVPAALEPFCSTDVWDRAQHTYGMAYTDRLRAFNRQFDNPPDIVAYPGDDRQLEAVVDWCCDGGHVMVPFGGGSSAVWGVNPPAEAASVVSVDLTRLDKVLEVDEVSGAARIQAGALGPTIEDQLRPRGLTLRHFPHSRPSGGRPTCASRRLRGGAGRGRDDHPPPRRRPPAPAASTTASPRPVPDRLPRRHAGGRPAGPLTPGVLLDP